MNAQEYIASGLLDAYVLGALPGAEAAEVARAIARYPEVAAEVRAIEEAMYQVAIQQAVTPPPQLQQDIWQQINAGNENPVRETVPAPVPQVVPLTPPRRISWAYAAVWIALIGSLIANFMLWSGRRQMEDGNTALRLKLDTLSQSQRDMGMALARYQREASMMADPDMKPVVMQTMQKGHPMAATVYWSQNKGEAYVSVQKLPMPPQGKQYQLWVIADGKPVDLGVLRNDMVGRQGMEKVAKAIPGAQAFAISLEKEGGSPVPSMDQIYVMGKVI